MHFFIPAKQLSDLYIRLHVDAKRADVATAVLVENMMHRRGRSFSTGASKSFVVAFPVSGPLRCINHAFLQQCAVCAVQGISGRNPT
eukprot:354496-Chlamydomonas_euryale.AAC.3